MTSALLTQKLRRPSAVWWSVLVAVLFALAPTLTQALAVASLGGEIPIEICTAQGSKTLAPDGEQHSPATHTHCLFCLHLSDRYAPAPQQAPSLFLAQGRYERRAICQDFFYLDTTSLWSPPRGPPPAIDI
jgi:Protein of unknown function (DUF2946)